MYPSPYGSLAILSLSENITSMLGKLKETLQSLKSHAVLGRLHDNVFLGRS